MIQQLQVLLFYFVLKTVFASKLLSMIDLSFIDEVQVCQIHLENADFEDSDVEEIVQNYKLPHFKSFSKSILFLSEFGVVSISWR